MPPLALIIAGLFIKAFSVWLKLQESPEKSDQDKLTVKEVIDEILQLLFSRVVKKIFLINRFFNSFRSKKK